MNKHATYLVYALALIKFIFPFFLVDGNFQLHATEFVNFDTAKNFQWGYINGEPPLLNWISLMQHQFAASVMVIKFVPAAFGALTYLFVGLIIVELGGKLFATFLAFLPFVLSIYLPLQFYYGSDTLAICFFAAISFFIIKYSYTKQIVWLYFFGVFIGLGLLSSNLFYIIVLLLVASFALSKRYKIVFTSLHFYLALAIGVGMFLPHLIWQQNQVLNAHTNIAKSISIEAYSLEQLLFILGGSFIWIIGILYIALTPKGREHLPFLIVFIVTNFIFFIEQEEAKNLLPMYAILLAFGAYNIERLTTRYVRILRYVSITPLFYVGFMSMPAYMPILPPDQLASLYLGRNMQQDKLLIWEDNNAHDLPQHFAEMIGYKEILEKVAKVYHGVNEQDKANTIIVSKNRVLAAAVNFYRNDYQLPTTIVANEDFYFTSNINTKIVNVVFIGNPIPETNIELFKNFENSYLAEEFNENNYSKFKGTKIMLYLKANETLNNLVKNNNVVINTPLPKTYLANK